VLAGADHPESHSIVSDEVETPSAGKAHVFDADPMLLPKARTRVHRNLHRGVRIMEVRPATRVTHPHSRHRATFPYRKIVAAPYVVPGLTGRATSGIFTFQNPGSGVIRAVHPPFYMAVAKPLPRRSPDAWTTLAAVHEL
jgi:hypothetical protein